MVVVLIPEADDNKAHTLRTLLNISLPGWLGSKAQTLSYPPLVV